MSEGSLFGEPGGCSDDAARIAALEAELRATRLESEARRVENDQLRGELAAERARAVSGDAAGEGFSGGAAPSPDTMAGMLATLRRCQADRPRRRCRYWGCAGGGQGSGRGDRGCPAVAGFRFRRSGRGVGWAEPGPARAGDRKS